MDTAIVIVLLIEALAICVLAFAVGHLVIVVRTGTSQAARPMSGLMSTGRPTAVIPSPLLDAARHHGSSSILAVRKGCSSCERLLALLGDEELDVGRPLVAADGPLETDVKAHLALEGFPAIESAGKEFADLGISATPLLLHFDHRGTVLSTELVPVRALDHSEGTTTS